MSSVYQCQHHGKSGRTDGEISHRWCGCDGTTHLACRPAPAPGGTPRPHDWPFFLAWPGGLPVPGAEAEATCALERADCDGRD